MMSVSVDRDLGMFGREIGSLEKCHDIGQTPCSYERYLAFFVFNFFTVRRSELHGLCDRNSVRPSVRPSVCPSVCHTRGLCPHGSTYDHDFFTIW